MGSARKDVWRNSESGVLPRSIAGLILIFSAKTAAFSKFNALVVYPNHVMWPNSTERERRYAVDHGLTSLVFLPAGAAELREGNGKQDVNEGMFMHGFALSEVVPFEDAILQTCWTDARKQPIHY